MQLAGTGCGLASEGSFTTGLGFLVEHQEVLIFIDEICGLELVEGTITTSPLPAGKAITTLAHKMAKRLATPCPRCHTPGFRRVNIERGLRCSDCGEPTQVIAADILGCGLCPHTVCAPRTGRIASPQRCDSCNP